MMNTQRGFALIEVSVIIGVVVVIGLVAWIIIANARQPIDQRSYSTQSLKSIPPLSDCTYINLDGMRIIRCPNSTTSTQWTTSNGKQTITHDAMVIDR